MFCSLERMAECRTGARKVRDIPRMSKKLYFPPALRDLTPEQAKKIIADGTNCGEEEAAVLLQGLQNQRHNQEQKAPVKETRALVPAWGLSGSHIRRKSC